jgi:hypothetical protein
MSVKTGRIAVIAATALAAAVSFTAPAIAQTETRAEVLTGAYDDLRVALRDSGVEFFIAGNQLRIIMPGTGDQSFASETAPFTATTVAGIVAESLENTDDLHVRLAAYSDQAGALVPNSSSVAQGAEQVAQALVDNGLFAGDIQIDPVSASGGTYAGADLRTAIIVTLER